MKKQFYGGIHPAERKDLTERAQPGFAPEPSWVTIPLRQHIGAPCRPLVQVGDFVKMGQKIGDGAGLCVPVHASVSGIVRGILPTKLPAGGESDAIVIENDYQDTPAEELTAHNTLSQLSAEALLSIIHEAGIVGMGGAAFPTKIKADAPDEAIHTLIANACECEPYLTADDALLCYYPEEVLRGMGILARILRPQRMILAIEENKAEAIAVLRGLIGQTPNLSMMVLPTRYPQGGEKQLIYAVTGREVPSGKLPKSVGCAVFNVATCAAISGAVYGGQPAIRRLVCVTGENLNRPQNLIVRIGTSFETVIAAAGGRKTNSGKIIAGGPMMGFAVEDGNVPVVKNTNAILCLPGEFERNRGTHCIRCGRCAEGCPMRLQPMLLYRGEKAEDLQTLERLHLMDCIECGCCAYLCPGQLPLVERFREGKKKLKERRSS